jgi:hypothetical protein
MGGNYNPIHCARLFHGMLITASHMCAGGSLDLLVLLSVPDFIWLLAVMNKYLTLPDLSETARLGRCIKPRHSGAVAATKMHFSTLFTFALVAAGSVSAVTFDAIPSKPRTSSSLIKRQATCSAGFSALVPLLCFDCCKQASPVRSLPSRRLLPCNRFVCMYSSISLRVWICSK